MRPLALLARIPPLAWLCLALALYAAWGRAQVHQLRTQALEAAKQASIEALWSSELARQRETRWTTTNMEISNALNQAQAARNLAARNASDRLRQLAEARTERAATEAALATCRGYQGSAVRVIPDAARESLIELATDADAVTDQLRACQRYVRDICLTD